MVTGQRHPSLGTGFVLLSDTNTLISLHFRVSAFCLLEAFISAILPLEQIINIYSQLTNLSEQSVI